MIFLGQSQELIMDNLCLPEPLLGPVPEMEENMFEAALRSSDLLEEEATLSVF